MKKPIALNAEHLSSLLSALLMERGLTEYTLEFETYEELNLEGYGLQYSAEFDSEDEDSRPVSITVTLFKVE